MGETHTANDFAFNDKMLGKALGEDFVIADAILGFTEAGSRRRMLGRCSKVDSLRSPAGFSLAESHRILGGAPLACLKI